MQREAAIARGRSPSEGNSSRFSIPTPVPLQDLLRRIAPDIQLIFVLFQLLDLDLELILLPAFRVILPIFEAIDLTFDRFFLSIPFVVELIECLVARSLVAFPLTTTPVKRFE